MGKKYLFVLLICIQLTTILFLGKKIYHDKVNTLGVSINIINGKEEAEVKLNHNSKLKYFYEPIADTTVPEARPWEPEKVITTTINSDTLNNPPSDVLSATSSTIVTIGDSFTYGQYVESRDSWVRLLEKEIDRVKDVAVINLGVPGYDIEYAVERFRIRGQKYNPKLVIWLLKDDDFISIAEVLTPLIEEEQKLFEKNEMKERSELFIPKKGHSDPIFIERALSRFWKMTGGTENISEYQDRRLRSLREYYDGNIVIMHSLSEKYMRILKKWEQSDKRIILMELPNMDRYSKFPDGHPNEVGHLSIADALYDFLIKKNLIPL